MCSNKSTIYGTPASLAEPAARKAAARITCNVQAPMRREGRTDWMEVALILDSFGCEVESENRLRCRPSWQKPIYSDDIHRYLRYVAAPPGVTDFLRADKPDTERDGLQSRLVCLDSSPAPQPMIFAKR